MSQPFSTPLSWSIQRVGLLLPSPFSLFATGGAALLFQELGTRVGFVTLSRNLGASFVAPAAAPAPHRGFRPKGVGGLAAPGILLVCRKRRCPLSSRNTKGSHATL